MREIARGRASVVYDLGDARVLRVGGAPAREAATMRHAREHGYPVPVVHEERGDALVLERIDGPTMLEVLLQSPADAEPHMRVLATLHERLHGIPAPTGDGRLLHLDLHPGNVILSAAGPVVIDWTNARGGDPLLDTALTYLILATNGGDTGRRCAEAFARLVDVESGLDAAAAHRAADANVSAAELAAVEQLRRERPRAGSSAAPARSPSSSSSDPSRPTGRRHG